MTMLKSAFNKVKVIYHVTQQHIFSLIEKYRLSERQIDDFALKLDVIGGSAVAQAIVFPAGNTWLSLAMVIISFVFCAILWTTSFIMKGFKDE